MMTPDTPKMGTISRGSDDQVIAFRTLHSRAQGRLVRLGASVDDILAAHDYPEPISKTLGEAIALTAMLGSLVNADGRLILQTKTDGPLKQLVVHFRSPGEMRALAHFDADRLEAMLQEGRLGQGHLLGNGHLAIDPGGSQPRTQGIVALANHELSQAAHTYFRQSEQIPTFVRLAVARHQTRQGSAGASGWHWRAGGLIIQKLPEDIDVEGGAVGTEADDDYLVGEREDDWQRVRTLAATVEDHELLDPTLEPERLLYRLFAEEGVRAADPISVAAHCGCTRDRVENLLKGFGADELADMREDDGGVTVTCDYCNAKYKFTSDDVSGM